MRKLTHTAAIVLLLLCFVSASAGLLSVGGGSAHADTVQDSESVAITAEQEAFASPQSGAAQAVRGGMLLASERAKEIAQKIFFVFFSIVGVLALLALFLFMVVFPLINRIAHTNIPCLDVFSPVDSGEEEGNASQPSGADKSDSEQVRVQREKPKKKAKTRTTPLANSSAAYKDDRPVKTVNLDHLSYPEDERTLTASEIDKIIRQAKQEQARQNSEKKK